jgi:hypothetical protein
MARGTRGSIHKVRISQWTKATPRAIAPTHGSATEIGMTGAASVTATATLPVTAIVTATKTGTTAATANEGARGAMTAEDATANEAATHEIPAMCAIAAMRTTEASETTVELRNVGAPAIATVETANVPEGGGHGHAIRSAVTTVADATGRPPGRQPTTSRRASGSGTRSDS